MPTQLGQANAEGMPKNELPEQKVRRLAKEISAALGEIEGYEMVMVFPASSQQFSVQICLDGEFAGLMQRVRALREGVEAWAMS